MTAVRRLMTTILMFVAATSLLAQSDAPATQAGRQTQAVTAETDRDATDPRALRLSLDEAVRNTMTRNLGIDLQRFDTQIAGEEVRRQYGTFDPLLGAEIERRSVESTALSTIEGGGSRTTSLGASIQHFLPTGGSYRVNFDNSRATASGPVVRFSPSYSTGLTFAATQPLLRDFGVDINRRGITIARNNLGISREAFRDVLRRTALSVELAYLDLVYARRNVEVIKESLFLARDQARITQIRIDVGASAPLDILQPNVQIAQSEETLIRAVATVRDAEDRLRQLMNLDPAEWDRPIVPTDNVDYTAMTINVQDAVTRAFERRPEIRQDELRTANARVQYLFARNQVLPALDLNVGYGLAGIAGRVLGNDGQPDPDLDETGYFDALENVFGNEFPSWNIGLSVSMPLTNIAARAARRQAELDLERSRESQALTRQNIAIEVRGAARDVDTAARAIVASRTAREAAERNVEAERRRYENGMTTNFQVLQVQQQLSDARRLELQAVVGYNAAIATFQAATGNILEVRNITAEEPEIAPEPQQLRVWDRYNWLNYGSRVTDPKLEETTTPATGSTNGE